MQATGWIAAILAASCSKKAVLILLSLLLADLLAAISPGPNFVVVSQGAIHRGRWYAVALVGGVTTANLMRMPAWVQVTTVSIVLMNTVVWYGTVAVIFSHRIVQQLYAAIQHPFNRVAGALMIGFGARLLVIRD